MDAATLIPRSYASVRGRMATVLITLARGYMRYAPVAWGKQLVWTRMKRRMSLRPRNFEASTVFGCRIAGSTRDVIQRHIYLFGLWEPPVTRWICRRLRSGDTFIDVGANIGYFTLLASRLVGDHGRVVAIEASPRIFSQLQSNLSLNGVLNVRAVNVAISDGEGVVKLYRGPDWNIGQTTAVDTGEFPFEGEVAAASLSVVLRPEELRKARIMKIDIEGMEWSALQGILPVLGTTRVDFEIVCEVLPERLALQGKTAGEMLRLMSDAGFHAYYLSNDYSPEAYLRPYVTPKVERIWNGVSSDCVVVFSRTAVGAL